MRLSWREVFFAQSASSSLYSSVHLFLLNRDAERRRVFDAGFEILNQNGYIESL